MDMPVTRVVHCPAVHHIKTLESLPIKVIKKRKKSFNWRRKSYGIHEFYQKDSGRRIRHESLHLTLDEVTDEKGLNRALEIFFPFALFYYYNGFQTIYSVHQTQNGFHAHYAINTVSFVDRHKYHSNHALLNQQESYAACLIKAITQKAAFPAQKIAWEEFEFSDTLYLPEGLFASFPH